MRRVWDGDDEGGTTDSEPKPKQRPEPGQDPRPAPTGIVRHDPDVCPFCRGAVEHGQLVWRDDPVSWQPEGTRHWWHRERLAPTTWGIGRRRLPAHRCSSCQRYWFSGVFLEL